MNSSLIFHIGLEKTGTTSFQHFCSEQTSTLEALGIHYPKKDFLFSGNNHRLLAAAYLDKSILDFVPATSSVSHDSAVSSLVEDLESGAYDKILLSSEHFSSRFSDSEVEKLASDFGCYHPKIIILIRDHYSLIRAAYSTSLNSGDRLTMADFLDVRLNPREDIPPVWRGIFYRFLRYREMIEPWIKYFGKENVVLLKYQKGVNVIEEIVSEMLGRNFTLPSSQKYFSNKSIDPGLMEYVRIFNTVTPYWGELYSADALNYSAYVGKKRSNYISIIADVEKPLLVPAMDCLAEVSYQEKINDIVRLDQEWLALQGFDLPRIPPRKSDQGASAVTTSLDPRTSPPNLVNYLNAIGKIDSLSTHYGVVIHTLQQAVENAQRMLRNNQELEIEFQELMNRKQQEIQQAVENAQRMLRNNQELEIEFQELMNRKQREIQQAEARVQELEGRLNEIHESTSWRMTSPIRLIGKLIKYVRIN
jgi:hypothetical protein